MSDQTPIPDQEETGFSWFVVALTIICITFVFVFLYMITGDYAYTSEFIGISGFIATFFAIYFAWKASQITNKKLDEILLWASNKTNDMSNQFNIKLSNIEYKKNVYRHIILSKAIERVLVNLGISYAAEYRISIKGTVIRPDFVIFIDNKRIPIELKTYPKRIVLPVSNQRITVIKNQIKRYMDSLIVNEAILIIWNPEITAKAKEKFKRVDNKTIYLINNDRIEEIENQLTNLLIAYKI